jgi:hypothetical protein
VEGFGKLGRYVPEFVEKSLRSLSHWASDQPSIVVVEKSSVDGEWL